VPQDDISKHSSSYFGLPNTLFDAQKGSQLFREYVDERIYTEEVGFDGQSTTRC
jgi:hypothetical protein